MNEILTKHLKDVLVEKIISNCSTKKQKIREIFFMQVKFVSLFCKQLQRTNRARDNSGHFQVQYLENIEPATEQSD